MKPKELRQRKQQVLLLANVDNCEQAVHAALIAIDMAVQKARGDWTSTEEEKVKAIACLKPGGSSSSGETSMREAIKQKRRGLAQLEYGHCKAVGSQAAAAALQAHRAIAPGDEPGHTELDGWIRWQETYTAAKAGGKSDDEARELAFAAQHNRTADHA